MAKTEKSTKPASDFTSRARWTIGLFRNAHGALIGAYTRTDGSPMPSEVRRVGVKPALHHGTYPGITYKAAKALLRQEAAAKGVVDEVKEKAPKASKVTKASKKAPAKRVATKKSPAKKPAAKRVATKK